MSLLTVRQSCSCTCVCVCVCATLLHAPFTHFSLSQPLPVAVACLRMTVPRGEIDAAAASQDALVMGRFHKDMATQLLQAAQQGESTQGIVKVTAATHTIVSLCTLAGGREEAACSCGWALCESALISHCCLAPCCVGVMQIVEERVAQLMSVLDAVRGDDGKVSAQSLKVRSLLEVRGTGQL